MEIKRKPVNKLSKSTFSPAEQRRVVLDNWFAHAARASKKHILADQLLLEGDEDIKEYLREHK